MFQGLENWAKKPFQEEGDLLDWFLFLGMTVCITYLWTRVIKTILE